MKETFTELETEAVEQILPQQALFASSKHERNAVCKQLNFMHMYVISSMDIDGIAD